MFERIWIGRFLAGLVIVFLGMDALAHLLVLPPVVQAFQKLGLPETISRPAGILMLLLLALFAWRRARILAAVLINSYLGGAVALQWRAGSTLFEIVFPIVIGAFLWTALLFLDARARVAAGIEG